MYVFMFILILFIDSQTRSFDKYLKNKNEMTANNSQTITENVKTGQMDRSKQMSRERQ